MSRRHCARAAPPRIDEGKLKLEESQAAAAVGQIRLAHAYKECWMRTKSPSRRSVDPGRHRAAPPLSECTRHLNTLLALGACRINENDTVATAEIRYGDNDRLPHGWRRWWCRLLVPLSDIDGLYTANPTEDPDAEFIGRVLEITPAIEAMAGGAGSDMGSGGMQTKIAAAKIAVGAGCHLCIAKGAHPHPLQRIEEGARCTWFVPSSTPVATRKQWIAGTLRPAGAIVVDDGAVRALMSGKSLLPAGVTRAVGRFDRGDTVSIIGPDVEVARASARIRRRCGAHHRPQATHRAARFHAMKSFTDDLVVIKAP